MKLGQLEEFLASTVSGKDFSIQRETFYTGMKWSLFLSRKSKMCSRMSTSLKYNYVTPF